MCSVLSLRYPGTLAVLEGAPYDGTPWDARIVDKRDNPADRVDGRPRAFLASIISSKSRRVGCVAGLRSRSWMNSLKAA